MTDVLAPERPDFRALVQTLPTGWRQRLFDARLIVEHPDTVLDDPDELMHLVLLHIGCELPLRQTVAWVKEAGGAACSHVTLHRKMKRIGPVLQEMVAVMGDARLGVCAEAWAGYELVALDGSVVVSPGPTGTGGRLHVALRLADLSVVGAQVSTTAEGETLRRFAWSKNQLVIGDRGYANPAGVGHVVLHGADILLRVNRGSLPLYDDSDERIDLLIWTRTLAGRRTHSRPAIVQDGATAKRIRGRLIAQRLPADKIADAQRRVRREVGDDPIALEMAQWMILFTTVAASRLDDKQIVEAYRLRWQVELLFKRWKSICRLNKLPNYRSDTLVAWLTGKLLLLLCAERLAQPATSGLFPPIDITSEDASSVARRTRSPTVEADHHHLAHNRRRSRANAAA